MMRFLEIFSNGDSQSLRISQKEIPKPNDDDVLIKVEYVGVNRIDILQKKGLYNSEKEDNDVLGVEVSGTIVNMGSKAYLYNPTLKEGMKVCALLSGGGYAEYVTANSSLCFKIEENFLTMEEAACMPEALFTIWKNLIMIGDMSLGSSILIHGGSSGIGTMAIKVANLFNAKPIIVTAGNDKKCSACIGIGADYAINYKKEDFVKKVMEMTNGEGVDIVLDMVGGEYLRKNISCLKYKGKIINIAFLDGAKSEIVIPEIMKKEAIITGSYLKSSPIDEKCSIACDLRSKLWPFINKGLLKPVIDSVYDFEKVEQAHERMENSMHIGKIVLSF